MAAHVVKIAEVTDRQQWFKDTLAMCQRLGYRTTPLFKNKTSKPYAKGQNYPDINDYKDAVGISVILDDVVLVDFDGNKAKADGKPIITPEELASVFGLDSMPTPVQMNNEGDSIHWFFKIPEGFDLSTLKQSADGAFPHIDIKTGNQLMHLKPHKIIVGGELPEFDDLSEAPEALLDILRKKDNTTEASTPEVWEGDEESVKKARELLALIDPDHSYARWLSCLMAIHSKFGNTDVAFHLCNDWCAEGIKYNGADEIRVKLKSFDSDKAGGITFNYLRRLAGDVIDIHELPSVEPDSWPHKNSNGVPLNTLPNFNHLLDNYGFQAKYNVIKKAINFEFPGQVLNESNPNNNAFSIVSSLCALNRMPKSDIPIFLVSTADKNEYNPVTKWILSKPWDGVSRLEVRADTLKTPPEYNRDLMRLLLRCWLLSAVAAAFLPRGFKSKGVLVLQGDQDIGKTSWFQSLVPSDDEKQDWLLVDALLDPKDKDTVLAVVSHWLVELGELDGTFRKADIARLKGFISSPADKIRKPYGKGFEDYPRKTVFCASVDDGKFLVDPTGNSRFWTIPVISIDHNHNVNMQQLWSEVYEIFNADERWWLDADEAALLARSNTCFEQVNPIEELILSSYDFEKKEARRMLNATQVLIECGIGNPKKAQTNDAARALRKIVGEPRKSRGQLRYPMPLLI